MLIIKEMKRIIEKKYYIYDCLKILAIRGLHSIHPKRRPGEKIFENVPLDIILPSRYSESVGWS